MRILRHLIHSKSLKKRISSYLIQHTGICIRICYKFTNTKSTTHAHIKFHLTAKALKTQFGNHHQTLYLKKEYFTLKK